jgi:hypothetical protein
MATTRRPAAKRQGWRLGVLEIAQTDEDSLLAGVIELVAQTFRRAAKHVSTERNLVLFTWDSIRAELTVGFTDRGRGRPSPDVLTLRCSGWTADAADTRAHRIQESLERVLAIGQEHVEELRRHGVYIAFTTTDEDASLEYI